MSAYSHDLISMRRSTIDLYANDFGVPFVEIESFAAYVGGSPTNIAAGSRRLGLKVAILTAVGQDPVGDVILHFLEEERVDTRFIPHKPLARSATIFATVRAQNAQVKVFCDLDFRADRWFDPHAFGVNIRAIMPQVDVAFGTEEEVLAAMLADPGQLKVVASQVSAPEITGDLEAAISSLLALGPEALVVKRSARGCTVYFRDTDPLYVPGFPVEVLTVLGAGDAFASGFLYGFIQGWDWYKMARMGNACGAIIVTRYGCANHMGCEQEVLQYIEERGGF